MKQYVGTKCVAANRMTRGEYNAYRGWTIPADENPDDAGYLVEYLDGGAPNDNRHAGYISWSPSDVFERAYRQIEDWRDRVLIEKDELADRLDKLTSFLASPKFTDFPTDQQALLLGQMAAMSSYLAILKLRLGEA